MNALLTRLRATRDEGFTLVELAVASAVLSIILLAVGGLMFSTTITQRTVTAVSQSASAAQSAADAIRTQMRNASEFRLTTVNSTDQLLIARVASETGAVSYSCRAWYYAASGRQLRSTTWAEAGSTVLPSNANAVATWSLLLDGVRPRAGTTIFKPPMGGTVEVSFEVDSDSRNDPTAVKFVAALPGGQGGGSTCWD